MVSTVPKLLFGPLGILHSDEKKIISSICTTINTHPMRLFKSSLCFLNSAHATFPWTIPTKIQRYPCDENSTPQETHTDTDTHTHPFNNIHCKQSTEFRPTQKELSWNLENDGTSLNLAVLADASSLPCLIWTVCSQKFRTAGGKLTDLLSCSPFGSLSWNPRAPHR